MKNKALNEKKIKSAVECGIIHREGFFRTNSVLLFPPSHKRIKHIFSLIEYKSGDILRHEGQVYIVIQNYSFVIKVMAFERPR